MSSLMELADRCEKATGSDRDLDAEIDVAVRGGPGANFPAWVYTNFPTWRARAGGRVEVVHHDGTGGVHWTPKHYTGLIDAAALLVPAGFFFDTQSVLRGTAIFDKPKAWAQVEETNGPIIETSSCVTLPLALCAAALRARSHKGGDEA